MLHESKNKRRKKGKRKKKEQNDIFFLAFELFDRIIDSGIIMPQLTIYFVNMKVKFF